MNPPLTSGILKYYSQIDLDDLHDPESSAGIILEMQDRNRYFEGRAATTKLGVTEDVSTYLSRNNIRA